MLAFPTLRWLLCCKSGFQVLSAACRVHWSPHWILVWVSAFGIFRFFDFPARRLCYNLAGFAAICVPAADSSARVASCRFRCQLNWSGCWDGLEIAMAIRMAMAMTMVGCLDMCSWVRRLLVCAAPMAIMAIAVDALTAAFQAVSFGCMLHRIATTSTRSSGHESLP